MAAITTIPTNRLLVGTFANGRYLVDEQSLADGFFQTAATFNVEKICSDICCEPSPLHSFSLFLSNGEMR